MNCGGGDQWLPEWPKPLIAVTEFQDELPRRRCMKLFKRTAKDADGGTPSAQMTSAPAEPKAAKNSLNTLLPGALAAVVGTILAGARLCFGPLNSAHQQQFQQL